jgi:type VI protein secretion system component VasF
LDDCIHALAQPLTALLFRLELGELNTDPQALRATLAEARTECQRAITALRAVRDVAHALGTTGELQ